MYLIISIIVHIVLLFFLTYQDNFEYTVPELLTKIEKLTKIQEEQDKLIADQDNQISVLQKFYDTNKTKEIINKLKLDLKDQEQQMLNLKNTLDETTAANEEITSKYQQYKFYSDNIILNNEIKEALYELEKYILQNIYPDSNIIFEILFDGEGTIVDIKTFNINIPENCKLDNLRLFPSKKILANQKALIKLFCEELN